jgi:hypothetical protein
MNVPPVFAAAAQSTAARLIEAIECPPGNPEDLLPSPPRAASPAAGFYTYRTVFPELRFAAWQPGSLRAELLSTFAVGSYAIPILLIVPV